MGALNQIPDSRRADAVEIGLLIQKHVSVIYNESRAFTSGIDEAVASIVLYLENGAACQSSQPTTPPPVPATRVAGLDREAADTFTRLTDAALLGEYFDSDPDERGNDEAEFLASIRRDYPEHVDVAEAIARRSLKALAPTPGETPGQDAVAALRKIAELRFAENANEPFDDALDIADAALASLRSTQADTGGESQTPAPAGDAVEALAQVLKDWHANTSADPSSNELDAGARAALAAIAQGPGAGQTDAARNVLAERRRQVEAEGWTPEHDDTHSKGEMVRAAANYAAMSGMILANGANDCDRTFGPPLSGLGYSAGWDYHLQTTLDWPWSRQWWKPGPVRPMLVKAGALILAEIERLDRASLPAAPATAASERAK
ncbi:hypothetical protein [Methylobacterium sp. WL9]|uniref:hypothetical protein n=1 Tax=Methylobacterium sp. WL9 TaxID=2603898 RepID=UPI0011C7D63E|nr:hypothetical protein [Methylobacterium sp. WL9]TXN24008.1 hypothetical protein FV217_04900 [Methylobacterium sp. WL9]